VKPGTSSNILNKSVLIQTSKFTSKHFIVIWHGSKDVSNSKVTYGVKNILQFVTNNLHSNIVISMPYRCDLPISSYVNKEISLFNKKLEKSLKSFNGVSLRRIILERTPLGLVCT
jgi:hypothetical protein